ncbi:putative Receptor protein kinase [Melia azedarach]|uniref:Receptor protein kinase n=1 Tax=Melia azedarach TaxID=155640 RepID=A0ACC1YJE4_MELAZ|nr:putative Receptor protein kinase [Melia azedarach]
MLTFSFTVSSDASEEANALFKWKTSLHHYHLNSSILPSWTLQPVNATPTTSMCSWSGIHCSQARRVIAIYLTNMSLKGTLQEFSFSSFPQLEYLDLSFNEFSGIIPPQISKLSKLKFLYLQANRFSGKIPPEVGLRSHLNVLALWANQLTGSIPPDLGQLSSLKGLFLYSNLLEGSIPSSLSNLTNLDCFYLKNNSLFGSIPLNIGNLRSFYELDLSENQLSGSIPLSFGDMGKLDQLSVLDLSHNIFGGEIPSQICNMASLENLSLSHNNLSGLIPNCFEGMRSLSNIDISCNELQGPIPNSTAFRNASIQELQENAGLCGEVNGLSSCQKTLRVRLSSTNILAIKKFHSPLPSEMVDQHEFFNEIKALAEIRHRNIIKFYGFCSHSRHSFLVYEYLESGYLATILSDDALAGEFCWTMRMNAIKGVANALSYMHHDCFPPIVHRDISTKNVLLDLEYKARVSDFGIAKFLNPNSSNWTEFAGIYGYAAPELAYTMKVTEKCNVYSFGVLALEVINGKHPGDFLSSISSSSPNTNISLDQVLDPRLPYPSFDVRSKLTSIMNIAFLCVDKNPNSRPIMSTVSQLLCM